MSKLRGKHLDSTLEDERKGRAQEHEERDSMRWSPSFFNNTPAKPKALLATALLPLANTAKISVLVVSDCCHQGCHPEMML